MRRLIAVFIFTVVLSFVFKEKFLLVVEERGRFENVFRRGEAYA